MHKNPWKHREKIAAKSLYGAQPPVKPVKAKWRIGKVLWSALKKTCMVLGAIVLINALVVLWALSSTLKENVKPLPGEMVLHVELDGNLGELPSDVNFVDPFSTQTKTVKSFIDTIYVAKDDDRIKGIYAHFTAGGYSLAHIQEMRQAIIDFRASGKFAYVYSTSYTQGLGGYYLASAFDEIWLQPMGMVMLGGINIEMPFFRDVLDRIGIEPQFMQRKEYKSAYESFSNKDISTANAEAMQKLVDDFKSVIVSDISKSRGFSEGQFEAHVNRGLIMDNQAKASGLVDKVVHIDTMQDAIAKAVDGSAKVGAGDDLIYIDIDAYARRIMQDNKLSLEAKPKVALVYAVGAIVDSKTSAMAQANGFVDDGYAAADQISEALLEAAIDDNIKAVILRIDSPGGSPVASETILRAVRKVQEKGKKVIVSMGPTAASGGYWIATYADHIFVSETTITGSIGVLGGKVSLQALWKTLGVNWARLGWGDTAGMWSMNTPFSEQEAARMNAMLDHIYDSFLERVSAGRVIPMGDVEKIARGRIWTGKSAVANGLADQFGGLNEALDYAAQKIKLKDRRDVNVVIMPKPLTPIEQFIELLETQARAGKIVAAQATLFQKIAPAISQFMIMNNAHTGITYTPLKVE